MKQIFLSAATLLLSLSSFAQRIHFSDSTNQWTYYTHNCSGESGVTPTECNDTYSGDTMIEGMIYKKFLHYATGGGIYVREDTIAQKVYLRGADDSGDNVLYDYTLNVGDTFYVDTSSPAATTFYVASIDSVQINALWYKTWHFILASGIDFPGASYTVIEGIGCDVHPLYPLVIPENGGELCANLTCFHNNGAAPLVSPEVDGYFDNASSCGLTYTGIKNIATDNTNASIYPDPIDQTSKIVFSNNIASGTLTVLNDIGETILSNTFQNKEELLIGDKINRPGIYFYRVTDNESNTVFTGKFICR